MKVTLTTWTCARCGATEEIPGIGQPANWTRAYFATPPEHSEHTSIADLCNPCGGLLVDFVHNNEEQAIRQATWIAEVTKQVHEGAVSDVVSELEEIKASVAP